LLDIHLARRSSASGALAARVNALCNFVTYPAGVGLEGGRDRPLLQPGNSLRSGDVAGEARDPAK